MSLILALDQGTTGSAALVFDDEGRVRGHADREIAQHYPASGHVEHDADELFATTVAVGREALAAAGVTAGEVTAIGITNQRETVVVWERATGRPIHRAVVWQSRASARICDELRADGLAALIRARTGLVIDAYFSGPKVRWILDQVPGAQARAEAGELLCGTIESWLVWKLTGGRAHLTDVSNASRTLVFDIHRRKWDGELLDRLALPRALLPRVVANSGAHAETAAEHFGAAIPITGLAGDQQAALFGQGCVAVGQAKNTYGTGCFLLANTGTTPATSEGGLLTTIAWDIGDGVQYALEGSAFSTGAAVQWLRDGLGIIGEASETDALARAATGAAGLFLVPAFTGLGAPHWDPDARGLLIGIERSTSRADVVRATLESIAFQTRDLVEAMRTAGRPIAVLRADGGGTANRYLMQRQADLLGVPVEVAALRETTALGAAFLAGLGAGVWTGLDELARRRGVAARYEPAMTAGERDARYGEWLRAVDRARDWRRATEARAPASST